MDKLKYETTELRTRGNWHEVKGKIRKEYGNLTDDDLEYQQDIKYWPTLSLEIDLTATIISPTPRVTPRNYMLCMAPSTDITNIGEIAGALSLTIDLCVSGG